MTNENKKNEFDFVIDKSYFLTNKEFCFDNFCFYVCSKIFNTLLKLKKDQITWDKIEKNPKYFNYGKVENDELKRLTNGVTINIQSPVYKMKTTAQERFFFYRIQNVCHVIGYDKFHFLYFTKPESERFRKNKIKHHIYNIFNNLLSNANAEKEVEIILDELKVSNIFHLKPKSLIKKIKIALSKYKPFYHNIYDNIEHNTMLFFKKLENRYKKNK